VGVVLGLCKVVYCSFSLVFTFGLVDALQGGVVCTCLVFWCGVCEVLLVCGLFGNWGVDVWYVDLVSLTYVVLLVFDVLADCGCGLLVSECVLVCGWYGLLLSLWGTG